MKRKYKNNHNFILVACSVGFCTVSELRAMVDRMQSSQLRTVNLTNNDLVKDHLRHLVSFLVRLLFIFMCLIFCARVK